MMGKKDLRMRNTANSTSVYLLHTDDASVSIAEEGDSQWR